MKLTDVIRRPLITEKTSLLREDGRTIVFEVAPGEAEALDTLVRHEMADAADLTVPLDVSVGTGSSWHEAAH